MKKYSYDLFIGGIMGASLALLLVMIGLVFAFSNQELVDSLLPADNPTATSKPDRTRRHTPVPTDTPEPWPTLAPTATSAGAGNSLPGAVAFTQTPTAMLDQTLQPPPLTYAQLAGGLATPWAHFTLAPGQSCQECHRIVPGNAPMTGVP